MKSTRYRSGLERAFAAKFPDLPYEPTRLPYSVTHTYTPDFSLGENLWVETKGLFTSADRTKHLYVRKTHPNQKVLFVFQQPEKTLSKKSKTTYADWCNLNGFKWLHIDQALRMSKEQLIQHLTS